MNDFLRGANVLICVVTLLWCELTIAGVTEGIDALGSGDYVTALRELRPAAERGNAEAQYRLGVMVEFGRGIAIDKPQAWRGTENLQHRATPRRNSSWA